MLLTTNGVRISTTLRYKLDFFEVTVKNINVSKINPSNH